MHHRSPPPFSSSNHPIERRRCRCDPPETHLQFLARGSHAGRVITRRYYTERSFPSKPGEGGRRGGEFRGHVIHLYLCDSPLRFQSIDLIFHFSFINHVSLPRQLLDPRSDVLIYVKTFHLVFQFILEVASVVQDFSKMKKGKKEKNGYSSSREEFVPLSKNEIWPDSR